MQLDIAQRHIDKGDEVEFLLCDGILPICEINLDKSIDTCLQCISRRNHGLSLIVGDINKVFLRNYYYGRNCRITKSLRTEFRDLDDLKKYKFEQFPIGDSVYSSICDIKRQHNPDLNQYKTKIKDFILSASFIYQSVTNYINKQKPDLIYIFNGRHAIEKPVLSACIKNNTDFATYEFSYNGGYQICHNTQPQDLAYRYNQMVELWKNKNIDDAIKRKIGAQFYEKNIGQYQGYVTLTKNSRNEVSVLAHSKSPKLIYSKKHRKLPKNWNKSLHNIVYFLSSEYEAYTAREFYQVKTIYKSQLESIKRIMADLEGKSDYHLYIRMHPAFTYFKNISEEYYEYFQLDKKYDNLTIILPTSEICSYFLMDKADKVLVYWSTAGMEAAYKKKPVIVLWKQFLGKLNSVHSPTNHNDTMRLVFDKSLEARDITGALMYGYHLVTSGIKPKYYYRDSRMSYEEGWCKYRETRIDTSNFTCKLIKILHNQKLTLFFNLATSLFRSLCRGYTKGFN